MTQITKISRSEQRLNLIARSVLSYKCFLDISRLLNLIINFQIADLEITTKSLLAINAQLEANKHKQAKEIR